MDIPLPGIRWLYGLAAGLVALLALWLVAYGWRQGPMPIERISLAGEFREVDPQAVRAAVRPYLTDGFFAVRINAVQRQVEDLPWVEHARVERHWPATLQVRVWERKAFAVWNEQALVDPNAVVFVPEPLAPNDSLPRLSGPDGRERLVTETYMRLAAALGGTPFRVQSLSLNERGEWAASTSAGVELRLGQEPPESKIPVLRGAVTRTLRDRMPAVRYVDLRYTNGFAVGWRDPDKGDPNG